jgi:hypothetical protein
MQEFRLKKGDLAKLRCHEVDNPHHRLAAPMQLFLLAQIQELSKEKWGSKEPYIVGLREFDREMLDWFCEDMERMKGLSPEKFQYLIADRLEQCGLAVQIVGNVYRKDGGIDIVAFPNVGAMPFLLAVQAKHHRCDRKTGPGDVRDLHGVLTSRESPFHIGMLVTNTTFTPDARFFAENNKTLLRLRDIADLRRWLNDDFDNPFEWREIPKKITLAPGVEIEIPRPKLTLPPWYKQQPEASAMVRSQTRSVCTSTGRPRVCR